MAVETRGVGKRVQQELEEDPRTGDYVIEVIDKSGLVTLKGKVPSAEVKEVAEAIARDQEGVIGVTNALIVDPDLDEDEGQVFPPVVPGSQ